MKYGNFVGQGWIEISMEEAVEIKNFLAEQLNGVFKKDTFKAVKIEINNDDVVKHVIISFPFKKIINGRNVFGATIKDVMSVWFFITKDKKGYLEIKDEENPFDFSKVKRNFKDCPDFSWSCTMHVSGSERPYKCRHWESIQRWSPFTYGTEITDLVYSINDLIMVEKSVTPIKK